MKHTEATRVICPVQNTQNRQMTGRPFLQHQANMTAAKLFSGVSQDSQPATEKVGDIIE